MYTSMAALLFGEFPAEALTFQLPPAAAGVFAMEHDAVVIETTQPLRNVSPIAISRLPSTGKFAPSSTSILVLSSTDAELILMDVPATALRVSDRPTMHIPQRIRVRVVVLFIMLSFIVESF
jgi:hypothetical protein